MTFAGFVTLVGLAAGAGQEGDVMQGARLARDAVIASAPLFRVEVVDARLGAHPGCGLARAVVQAPPQRSGVVGVRWEGRDRAGAACAVGGWARVRLFSPAWVTTRAVRAEEPLSGAAEQAEREVRGGSALLRELPAHARAAATVGKGVALEARHLRLAGLPTGAPVVVALTVGDVRVVQQGVVVACPGRTCARLPNGKRVEGVLADGALEVTP